MSTEMETWTNQTASRVWVKKFGADGRLRDEIVAGDRPVHLTRQERQINQEMAANEELDIFKNGTMQATDATMKLLDGTEDAKEIAENPNHLSDSDIKSLVKSHHKTLEGRLKEIRNPVALQRLLEAARTEDASISTVERIRARLAEVAPSLYEEVTPVGGPSGQIADPRQGGLRAVTPK